MLEIPGFGSDWARSGRFSQVFRRQWSQMFRVVIVESEEEKRWNSWLVSRSYFVEREFHRRRLVQRFENGQLRSESRKRKMSREVQKENSTPSNEAHQYVGPYRLERTLGKGQTGKRIVLHKSSRINVKVHGSSHRLTFCSLSIPLYRPREIRSALCHRQESSN